MWIPRSRRIALALLLSLLAGGRSLQAQQTAPTDSMEVADVVHRYHAALSAGDTAAVMELLAPGAVVLESGGMESREEYRSHHLPADMAFAKAVARDRGPMHVAVHGDVAWASSLATTRGTFREREIDSQTAELMVLRRTDVGWRIEAIHWSSRNRRS